MHAIGSGQGLDYGQGRVLTAADGSYEMDVNTREGYAVYVDDKDWAAPSRLDVVVRDSKPVGGVDFKLTPGTIIRGTVIVGPGNRPAAKQFIGSTRQEAPRRQTCAKGRLESRAKFAGNLARLPIPRATIRSGSVPVLTR